jgi:hypothetical protein
LEKDSEIIKNAQPGDQIMVMDEAGYNYIWYMRVEVVGKEEDKQKKDD